MVSILRKTDMNQTKSSLPKRQNRVYICMPVLQDRIGLVSRSKLTMFSVSSLSSDRNLCLIFCPHEFFSISGNHSFVWSAGKRISLKN